MGTGVNPGGGGGRADVSPTFWVGGGGGWPVQISHPPPPLFEDKITLNFTFVVKKLTFLSVKLLKTPKCILQNKEDRLLVKWCIGHQGGGCGRGYPSDGWDFFGFGGLKPGFGCVIRLKLNSTLAPNVYKNCSIRGTVYLLSDVLDTKGEGVGGGIPLPRWGRFWILGF